MLVAALRSKVPTASGHFWVVLGALVISFSPVIVRLTSVESTTAGFYRNLIGGLILAGVALARGHRLKFSWRHWRVAVISALFFAVDLASWHRSVNAVGPGLGTILNSLQVFGMAAVGVMVFKERLSLRLIISLPMAFAGIYLLVGLTRFQADMDYRSGVLYGLLSGGAYIGFALALRQLQVGQTTKEQTANLALLSLICAVVMGTMAWFQGEQMALVGLEDWSYMLAYAVLGQALGWLLISSGLPRIPASQAGLLLLLQPALAFVWDMVLLGRPTTWLELVGAVMALGAIYLGSTRSRPLANVERV